MTAVADLVDVACLRSLAFPEAYDQGREMADRVRIRAFGPLRVVADVEGASAATVELTVVDGALVWTCSEGDTTPAYFCPHAIAVAVETWRRAPDRQPRGQR